MFDKNLEFKEEVFMIFFSIRCDDVDIIICYLFILKAVTNVVIFLLSETDTSQFN